MKRWMSATIAALALAIPATSASAAAPIRECGNYGWPEGYKGSKPIWTFGPLDGAGIFNVTTRRVRCAAARDFVEDWNGQSRFRGFRCRTRTTGIEESDTRCTASRGRVVRWQSAA